MGPATPTRIVISDASVLINFLHLERIDLFCRLPGYVFQVPEHVVAEVQRPDHAPALTAAIQAGHFQVVTMTDLAELKRYGDLRRSLGDGESACLAIAEGRGWMIACDEKRRFKREAEGSLGKGRVLNTPSLLLLAITKGLITVEEADGFKARLQGRRFHINIGSFAELLPEKK